MHEHCAHHTNSFLFHALLPFFLFLLFSRRCWHDWLHWTFFHLQVCSDSAMTYILFFFSFLFCAHLQSDFNSDSIILQSIILFHIFSLSLAPLNDTKSKWHWFSRLQFQTIYVFEHFSFSKFKRLRFFTILHIFIVRLKFFFVNLFLTWLNWYGVVIVSISFSCSIENISKNFQKKKQKQNAHFVMFSLLIEFRWRNCQKWKCVYFFIWMCVFVFCVWPCDTCEQHN